MILRGILFSFVSSHLLPTLATQVPSCSRHHWGTVNQVALGDEDPTEWKLSEQLPNPNDTDHLVFETVHSLLQRWPNTRMRNGHNIVPAVIPKGTLLYHGSNVTALPSGPDWVATDPEHSYLFCQSNLQLFLPEEHSGCWHFTLTASRPLKVVYFDGNSGAKMPCGLLDTQNLVAWGEVRPEDVWEEFRLIEDLCKWGKSFDVDGFVRMEANFEVMLCDFTSGVKVISRTNLACYNVTSPRWPPSALFEYVDSGSWHNRFPGETRFRLDLAGLVSFYDTHLAPSLVAARAGQERWDHRVKDISQEELSAVKSRLAAALIRPSGLSSGIDWKTLIQVIVDRFAGRLELTRHLLNSLVTDTDILVAFSRKVQTQLRIMLTPYILLSATPTGPSNEADLEWARPIYKHCATTHTRWMESLLDTMTDSERLLLRAVTGTSREICRVVTKMWAAGVYAGIDLSLNTKESLDIAKVAQVWGDWVGDLDRLMRWLDWSVWVRCDPDCGPEEICYLPTWPFGFPHSPLPSTDDGQLTDPDRPREGLTGLEMRTMVIQSLAKEVSNIIKLRSEDWIRPQPRCLRRVEPYEF